MEKAPLSMLIIALLLIDLSCYSQSSIQVSDPRLELKDNKIQISYDILNSSLSDQFIIDIQIKDANGNLIRANSLEGDIGQAVQGGTNKKIFWDFQADQIIMNGDIYINISAEVIPTAESSQAAGSKTGPAGRIGKETAAGQRSGEFTRTGLVLQSLAIPGLGLSRLKGRPHWIRGVAAYGCIAAAVALNRTAVSSYEDFKSAQNVESANSYLADASRQDNLSDVFGYAALGIWISDIVWTLVGTSDLKGGAFQSNAAGISIRSRYDPISNLPLVGIKYRF